MKNLFVLVLFFSISSISLNAQETLAINNPAKKAVIKNSIEWDQTTFEFGEITQNKAVEAKFELTNTGNEPLLLKEVKPSCGCTVANYTQTPILPGESTTITATYNAKKEGSFHKTVKVLTNLDDQPVLLKLKGKVVKDKI